MIEGKKILTIALLLVATIANSVPRWIHGLMFHGRKVYYIGDALSFVLILIARRLNAKDKRVQIIYELVLILAGANLTDELWGDPLNFGTNEKLFGIAVVTWITWRIIKCRKQPPIPRL